MRVAVLSLTRDRLWATKHCFQTLCDLSGCDFDHYVYDQASEDGTPEWLENEYRPHFLWTNAQNVGVSKGINFLLNHAKGYDVVVRFDNDCELLVDGTLAACAETARAWGYITSPHIQGLKSPPSLGWQGGIAVNGRGYRVGVPNIMGGIFMAAPASLYDTYRHDEANPIWGMDDAKIVDYWRAQGGEVGYLLDYPANHYLTTDGQAERDPVWFARKVREYNAA